MKLKRTLPVIACILLCFRTLAASVPHTIPVLPAFEDTTMHQSVFLPPAPVQNKKVGFFGKVKNMLGFAHSSQPADNSKASTKSVIGWIALGLMGLSLVLLAATSGAPVAGWLFLAGLLAGLVSLLMPKSATDKAEKKKSNKGALIAIAIGVGLVLALAIVIGSGTK